MGTHGLTLQEIRQSGRAAHCKPRVIPSSERRWVIPRLARYRCFGCEFYETLGGMTSPITSAVLSNARGLRPRRPSHQRASLLPVLARLAASLPLAGLLLVGLVVPSASASSAADNLVQPARATMLQATSGWPLHPQPSIHQPMTLQPQPWLPAHRGVDLTGSANQPVLAPRAGTIKFASTLAGRGVVVIDHGTERTTYEPVTALVAVGTSVSTGTPIGQLQATAASHCYPQVCLHWGRIDNATDAYLDPLELVGPRPVRLLPNYAPTSAGLASHPTTTASTPTNPALRPLSSSTTPRPPLAPIAVETAGALPPIGPKACQAKGSSGARMCLLISRP